MEDTQSVASLLQSTTSKIQQLQKAFAELESHRAVTLNLKWKQIEDHFHGLEKSLKRRFTELEDQENEFKLKTNQSQILLQSRQSAVTAKEEATLTKLQEKRDLAVAAITTGKLTVEQKPPPPPPPPLTNPQLGKLCQENDVAGLHRFISDNRKNLAAIKEEIPVALRAAVDPGGFVLDSVNGFYNLVDGKTDANLLGQRRTCIMLMECLSVMLEDVGDVSGVISEKVKERAKGIADEWKPKLDGIDLDASNGNSLEAHAFLQLVATFGIDGCFVKDDLVKLVPMVARRRQTADLCRFLGLSEKMPGVIDVLVNSGRHIDAVNLAFAFELTHQFSPVSLLKSYLTESRRVKSGNLQNDVSERELSALKSVIKCIEEHKLEDHYPVAPLQKRILQLEKAKADKKRATEVAKPQPKRPRANTISQYAPRNNTTNINITPDKNMYNNTRITDRYAPPPPPPPQTQYMYDNRPYGGYAVQTMGTPAYNMGPNHGGYFGMGYQYQAAYM